MRRFETLFRQTRKEQRLALLPYVMAGYPTQDSTVDLIAALVDAGADGFELGVPFSDPLADGPTVQRASQKALGDGMTSRLALELLEQARKRVDVPIAMMTYFNPVVRYGLDAYCRRAAEAGADALIVPDLPPEESAELKAACEICNLDLVQFVAPTSSAARVKQAARSASGWIYCVSLTGVTGARADLATGLDEMLAQARAVTTLPLVVGFGISRREHLQALIGKADGAIVASALIDAMDRGLDQPVAAAAAYLREILT